MIRNNSCARIWCCIWKIFIVDLLVMAHNLWGIICGTMFHHNMDPYYMGNTVLLIRLTYSDMSSKVGHIWRIDDCQLDHLIGGEVGGALVEELSNSPNFLSLFHGQEPVSSLHRNLSSPHHFFLIQKNFQFLVIFRPIIQTIGGRKWPEFFGFVSDLSSSMSDRTDIWR